MSAATGFGQPALSLEFPRSVHSEAVLWGYNERKIKNTVELYKLFNEADLEMPTPVP